MAKKPRENRVPIMMSDDELTAVDDWRYAHRVATRSDAVRRLCQMALIADDANTHTRKATDVLADRAMRLYEFVDKEPLGLSSDDKRRLRDVAGSAFEAAFKVLDAQLTEILRLSDLRDGSADIEHDLRRAREMREYLREKSPLDRMSESPEALEILRAEVEKSRLKDETNDKPDK